MAEPVDKEKEDAKEKSQIEKETKASKSSSWSNVPLWAKIAGVVVVFIKYNEINSAHGNLSGLWVWIIMVGVFWWFMGMEYKMDKPSILSPKECYDCLRKEIDIMRRDGRIKYNHKVVINPVQNYATHEAIPQYCIFSVKVMSPDAGVDKFKAMVSVKGETMGFVYMVQMPLTIRGDEAEHTKSIIPAWVKHAEEYPSLKGMFGLGPK